jgi:hypothetical protein
MFHERVRPVGEKETDIVVLKLRFDYSDCQSREAMLELEWQLMWFGLRERAILQMHQAGAI